MAVKAMTDDDVAVNSAAVARTNFMMGVKDNVLSERGFDNIL
jgi:hypothetical protein